MAKRKPFKQDSIGLARFELKKAQIANDSSSTRSTRSDLASAERFLLQVKKKRDRK